MDDLTNIFQTAFDAEEIEVYKPGFSPSQFPYCARRHFIYTYLPEDQRPVKGRGFYSEFFTEQGNTIHQVVQNALGRANLIYGNWECGNKFCKSKTVVRNQLGALRCKKCNKHMCYKELKLDRSLFEGMGGNIDGILPEFHAILEIKSKSKSKLTKITQPVDYEWVYQACSYANAVNIQFPEFDIQKVIMLYLNRDNPHFFKVFMKNALPGILQEQLKMKKEGDVLIKTRKLPDGICTDILMATEDIECPYAPICFSPELHNMLIY